MKFMLDIDVAQPANRITYADRLFLIGSCFTEHIGKRLEELKFPVCQNPHGILFDPVSVAASLNSYIDLKLYTQDELFYLNELWQSWQHHSQYSGMDATKVVQQINEAQQQAHEQLRRATWLIITLGSSFSYRLVDSAVAVANCHRAPGQWFKKHLLTSNETVEALTESMQKLQAFNPNLQVIFTISPVRHVRDGVVENNRSKARLLEAVHTLVETWSHLHYFPAYEIVVDVLRDYRFYDIDLVHPNYAATEFVFEKFAEGYIAGEIKALMEDIRKVGNSYRHKPFQRDTEAHRSFLKSTYQKVQALQAQLPHLDFERELDYFGGVSR